MNNQQIVLTLPYHIDLSKNKRVSLSNNTLKYLDRRVMFKVKQLLVDSIEDLTPDVSIDGKYELEITLFVSDKRKRDILNNVEATKPVIDYYVNQGRLSDDSNMVRCIVNSNQKVDKDSYSRDDDNTYLQLVFKGVKFNQ